MFLDASAFPFTRLLESRWTEIHEELLRLEPDRFVPWHEKHLYTRDWSAFRLWAFGKMIKKNCRLCPRTTEILQQVPLLHTAGFSRLTAGARIKPHRGYSTAVLRCHLGLVIPGPECILKVAGHSRRWEEGRCLVFDDTSLHEAWNAENSDRIILLIDFLKSSRRLTPIDRVRDAFLRFLTSPGFAGVRR